MSAYNTSFTNTTTFTSQLKLLEQHVLVYDAVSFTYTAISLD